MTSRLRSRIAAIGLWAVLLLAGGWVVLHTSVATDLTAFLPSAHTESERLLLSELRAGPAARTILIGLEGGPPQHLARLSKALAQRLGEEPGFVRVANGAQLLSDTERQRLFDHRYLLSPAVDAGRFDAQSLQAALQQRLRELASPLGGVDKQSIPADPTAEFRAVLESWRDPTEPDTRHGVWFDSRRGRALLLVQTQASAYDIDAQADALQTIRRAFAALPQRADSRMLLAGPGLYAVASRDATRRETQWLSVGASVAVGLILLLAYRSLPVLVLGALPLLSGVLTAAAAVSLWFGGIHGLTLAFGTTLLGIAIDYPIHVFSHGRGGPSVSQALARTWPTMRLGVLTTGLGFGALIGAGFSGLAQLGVFAVAGLVTAAGVTRWVLPALVPAAWRLPAPAKPGVVGMLERLRGRLGLLPAALIAVLLALWLGRGAFPWQDDLAALSPIPETLRQLDTEMRTALGAPEVSHALVISAPDAEHALQRTEAVSRELEQLRRQQALEGFTPASRFLPSVETQRGRQRQLPGDAQLKQTLAEALASLPFRSQVFEPFLRDVADARARTPLRWRDLEGTALGARVSALLFRGETGWTSVIPLAGVHDPEALARLADQAGPAVHYLDQRATARDLMSRFRQEGLSRALWSAAIIVIVLALALRSPTHLARVLFPMVLAAMLDLALLVSLGERITLFHLVALLMVLGAGVDYSLFFNRLEPDPGARRDTLHALLVCAISTATVFGILAGSDIPVLRAIGSTVAIGIAASLLFALWMARPSAAHAARRTT